MDACFVCIFLPDIKILLDIDLLDTVERDDIKIPDRLVVLRRVAGGHNDETFWHVVGAECFVLKELKHGRRERLGDAVYLVKEQNPFLHAAKLYLIIDGCDDFRHSVLSDRVFFAAVIALAYKRQTDRALPRVMRDRVRDQVDAHILRRLLHDRGLADSGRSDKKYRALLLDRDFICTCLILFKITADRVLYFCFCLLNVHCSCPFVAEPSAIIGFDLLAPAGSCARSALTC